MSSEVWQHEVVPVEISVLYVTRGQLIGINIKLLYFSQKRMKYTPFGLLTVTEASN
jgi:hypothetical protein